MVLSELVSVALKRNPATIFKIQWRGSKFGQAVGVILYLVFTSTVSDADEELGLHSSGTRDPLSLAYKGLLADAEVINPMGDNMIQKYCNIQVKALEGFLQSPGYPDYYPKTENCTWKVPVRSGQEVALTLLDVDLKVPDVFSGAQTCNDSLKIMNGSQVLRSICGGVVSSTTINISAVDVRVTLYSGGFQPKRGVFISYKVYHCGDLETPHRASMANSTPSVFIFSCEDGYLYQDTLLQSRVLQCLQNVWNDTLPAACVSINQLLDSGNQSVLDVLHAFIKRRRSMSIWEFLSGRMSDIVLPLVIVLILIIGNAVFLLYLFHLRHRNLNRRGVPALLLEDTEDERKPEGTLS
ncbi:unnamed protein product [Darwinula stevensoni]|uniref:CUB domain-containing protein n=1 Tax=Darwinula stevensoni TaxID=69355 RepID=A0A7R8WZU5_9CRUS|nr:unnamed protein product [Darwinula stevensoni]CAG0880966.1 unnamed protein product [Darwinula stevensoni]